MPKYDAFGREIGDDPLNALRATPQWAAYYRGGRIVIGDGHGRKQRVL